MSLGNPNTIFLFLEQLRTYMKKLRAQGETEEEHKKSRDIALEARHLKALFKYLNHDYDEIGRPAYVIRGQTYTQGHFPDAVFVQRLMK